MPVGNLAARAIGCGANGVEIQAFDDAAQRLLRHIARGNGGLEFPHLRITAGAFPAKTEEEFGPCAQFYW